MTRDYYVSATVQSVLGGERTGWSLWSERIQATSLVDAHEAARILIHKGGNIYGELHILNTDYDAKSADDIIAEAYQRDPKP